MANDDDSSSEPDIVFESGKGITQAKEGVQFDSSTDTEIISDDDSGSSSGSSSSSSTSSSSSSDEPDIVIEDGEIVEAQEDAQFTSQTDTVIRGEDGETTGVRPGRTSRGDRDFSDRDLTLEEIENIPVHQRDPSMHPELVDPEDRPPAFTREQALQTPMERQSPRTGGARPGLTRDETQRQLQRRNIADTETVPEDQAREFIREQEEAEEAVRQARLEIQDRGILTEETRRQMDREIEEADRTADQFTDQLETLQETDTTTETEINGMGQPVLLDTLQEDDDTEISFPIRETVGVEDQRQAITRDLESDAQFLAGAAEMMRGDLGATGELLGFRREPEELDFPIQETHVFEPTMFQEEDEDGDRDFETGELFAEVGEEAGPGFQLLSVADTMITRPGALLSAAGQEDRRVMEVIEGNIRDEEQFTDQPSFPIRDTERVFDSPTEEQLFDAGGQRTVTTRELLGDRINPEIETDFEEGRLLRGAGSAITGGEDANIGIGGIIGGGTGFGALARAGIPGVRSAGAAATGAWGQQITREVGEGRTEEAGELFVEGVLMGSAAAPRNVPVPGERRIMRTGRQVRREAEDAAEDTVRFLRGDLGERPDEWGVITGPSGRPREMFIETTPRTRRDVVREQVDRLVDGFIDQDVIFGGVPAPMPRTMRTSRPGRTGQRQQQQQRQRQRQRQEEDTDDDLKIIDIDRRIALMEALRDIEALKPDQTEFLPEPSPRSQEGRPGFGERSHRTLFTGFFDERGVGEDEAEGLDDAFGADEELTFFEETGETTDSDLGFGTSRPGTDTGTAEETVFDQPMVTEELLRQDSPPGMRTVLGIQRPGFELEDDRSADTADPLGSEFAWDASVGAEILGITAEEELDRGEIDALTLRPVVRHLVQ